MSFYLIISALKRASELIRLFYVSKILEEEEFNCIEKIKTAGSTYMCASGLTEQTNLPDMSHVVNMAEYAMRLKQQMEYVNKHSFNNFKLRIGKK